MLLAASGSLRIVCEPIAVNLAWSLIFGINQTFGRVVPLWTRSTDTRFFGISYPRDAVRLARFRFVSARTKARTFTRHAVRDVPHLLGLAELPKLLDPKLSQVMVQMLVHQRRPLIRR